VKVFSGQLVVRQFDQGTGLAEHSTAFTSLAELYQYCLAINAPQLVDRIVISGRTTSATTACCRLCFSP